MIFVSIHLHNFILTTSSFVYQLSNNNNNNKNNSLFVSIISYQSKEPLIMAKTATMTSHPIRKLEISSPNSINTINSTLKSNIIIVSKFDFKAENETELSVTKGDILKLLDRPGSGWILVKFIDKVQRPGLIPSSYVDIAINDPINPITLNWLHEIIPEISKTPTITSPNLNKFNDKNYNEWQINNSFKSNTPITINNKPYPILASISNFALFEDRYWYRLDITYSNNTKCYICRYYQDFYNLHISLLETLNQLDPVNLPIESVKLPKLPEPIPSKRSQQPKDSINLLLKRCNDLHIYMNKLILNKQYQLSSALISWLDVTYNSLPGFEVSDDDANLSNDEITNKVLPKSINIMKQIEQERIQLSSSESSTDSEKTESVSVLPKRQNSKNIYNHYHQLSSFDSAKKSVGAKSPHSNPNTSLNNGNYTTGNRSLSESSIFSANNTTVQSRSPDSPLMRNPSNKYSPMTSTRSNSYSYSNNVLPKNSFNRTPSTSSSPNTSFSSISSNNPSTPTPNTSYTSNTSPTSINTPTSSSNNGTHIKCKIMTPSNDILAIKLSKADITSLEAFKSLITKKIYFTYLYIRLPNQVDKSFRNIDNLNFNLLEFVKHNNKVLLRIS